MTSVHVSTPISNILGAFRNEVLTHAIYLQDPNPFDYHLFVAMGHEQRFLCVWKNGSMFAP